MEINLRREFFSSINAFSLCLLHFRPVECHENVFLIETLRGALSTKINLYLFAVSSLRWIIGTRGCDLKKSITQLIAGKCCSRPLEGVTMISFWITKDQTAIKVSPNTRRVNSCWFSIFYFSPVAAFPRRWFGAIICVL